MTITAKIDTTDNAVVFFDDSTTLTGESVPVRRVVVERIQYSLGEPERGEGMWNEGVHLVCPEDLTPRQRLGADVDKYEPVTKAMLYYWEAESSHLWHYADRSGELVESVDRDEFVKRYLRIFHPEVKFAERMTRKGYSQGDVVDLWVVADMADECDAEAIARATFDEYAAWAVGDVYSCDIQDFDAEVGEWEPTHDTSGFVFGEDQLNDAIRTGADTYADAVPSDKLFLLA